MKVDSLKKLYIEQLKDIFSAETMISENLPKMINAASSKELQNAFKEHLEVTRKQIDRLQEIFDNMNETTQGRKCAAMEGIIRESEELLSNSTDPEAIDAGLISSAQRIEHYEIAGYGTLRTYAEILGDEDARDLLQTTLDEEKKTDKKLTELAVSSINIEAKH